ncbi:MAG: hypothetical protein ACE5GK_06570 [Nitrospiria bacterium]
MSARFDLDSPFQGPPLSLISDAKGGIFLFYGDSALFGLAPLLAGWRLSRGERVLFLDGDNRFNPYPLVELAKEIGHDPKNFLSSLFISRAFTCHQMGSLVLNQLQSGLTTRHPRLAILCAPLETFYDEAVPFIEAKNLLLHIVAALRRLAPDRIFVILSPFPQKSAGRRTFFLSHLKTTAGRIFRVDRTRDTLQSAVRITEEKPEAGQWVFPIEMPKPAHVYRY